MARRIDNECAYCGEELEIETGLIGKDWKLYCSAECTSGGEKLSLREMEQLMKVAIPSRHYAALDETA